MNMADQHDYMPLGYDIHAGADEPDDTWDFLIDQLATGEIDVAEFRRQGAADGYSASRIELAIVEYGDS